MLHPRTRFAMRRIIQPALLLVLVAVTGASLAADPNRSQRNKLAQTQDAYTAAIRWSDFESELGLIDPQHLASHPLTWLEMERYRQLQVSSYRERGAGTLPDGSIEGRIEIGVINRNTL